MGNPNEMQREDEEKKEFRYIVGFAGYPSWDVDNADLRDEFAMEYYKLTLRHTSYRGREKLLAREAYGHAQAMMDERALRIKEDLEQTEKT